MPDTLKPFLLGKHLTAVTITPITIAATGVGTPGIAVSLLAYVASVSASHNVETEDIRPVWSTLPNMVPISEGEALEISVNQRSDALLELTSAVRPPTIGKRFRVAWSQGAEDFSGDYTFAGWTGGVANRGANMATARFEPCDLGNAAQVTYA